MEELKEYLIGFEQRINEKFDKIDEKFDKIDQRFEEIDKKFDKIDQRFTNQDERMDGQDSKIDQLRLEMQQNMKLLLDRQFLFEQEFSKKIDAIYDAVTLELEKNLEKSQKISKLNQRTERLEVNCFDHEKRISYLERNLKKV